jgi:hypothetical protein
MMWKARAIERESYLGRGTLRVIIVREALEIVSQSQEQEASTI